MSFDRLLAAAALACAACGATPSEPTAPSGIALLRISTLPGPCQNQIGFEGFPEIPRDLPYRRAQAVAAFEGGSRYENGAVVAVGWQEEDGTIGRLQLDFPPERGYGIAWFRPNAQYAQALAYAEYRDGQRTFAATKAAGLVNYVASQVVEKDALGQEIDHHGEWLPDKLFMLAALDGLDETGAAICRVIGLHAMRERPRERLYSPDWLTPAPAMAIVQAKGGEQVSPSLDAFTAPSEKLVSLGANVPDPGGPVKRLKQIAYEVYSPAGDGSDACD